MSVFLSILIGLSAIFLSKKLFGKWFNHLSLYSFIWMMMISLYQLKLIPFVNLSFETWTIIIGAYLSFFLGILTIFSARSLNKDFVIRDDKPVQLFLDGGKKIKYLLIVFSIIGLFSALQHWKVLLDQYGSIGKVLLNSYAIYESRLKGEVKGVIQYLWLFAYFGAFLGGLYAAFKNKITLLSIIPLIAIVLKELARLTRSGILFGLLEFLISFMLFRHLLNPQVVRVPKKVKRQRYKLIFSVIIVLILMVTAASLVKLIRNPTEEFQGTSKTISQFKGGAILSPSIYFYATSQIGVLNQYLEADKEHLPFGNSTFFAVYTGFSKFDLTEKPEEQHKGYMIPYWSNTATYLRDLHSDYGISGPFIFPYLLGLITTFFWFKLYERRRMIYHVILTHLYLIIGISFFILATRFPYWFYGLLLFLCLIPLIEKLNSKTLIK